MLGHGASTTNYNYNYNSSSITNNGQSTGYDSRSSRPEFNDKPSYPNGSPHTPDIHGSSSPRVPSSPRDSRPSGVNYYSKYHSTQEHQSQRSNNGPMAFPTNTPAHHVSKTIQSPPKRVDELMSELADFDPSIQPSDIVEPNPTRSRHVVENVSRSGYKFDDQDSGRRYNHQRGPSPSHHVKQVFKSNPKSLKLLCCWEGSLFRHC